MTKKTVKCGKLLDIEVCDHLKLSIHRYISLRDEEMF
ncbi:JAB domain-containing protein [Sphingobacterium daejeonense]